MIIILNISIDFKFIYCSYITEKKNMGKILIEIRKGIAIGLLLTSFYASLYGIKEYIYNLKTKFEEINSYRYKWSENKKSIFVKRNLGYEKRFSKTPKLEELENGLKDEYCNAIREIEKVDRKIVPGTNIPFKEATYIQVDDAYKEYLQKIAQIRQIFFMMSFKMSPDKEEPKIEDLNLLIEYLEKRSEVFEDHMKCKYKDTKWNMDNTGYIPVKFENLEIIDYYRSK
jgi:hypothetical protein